MVGLKLNHVSKRGHRQYIKADEHVISHAEKQIHITACRKYRKLRQRKQRDFHRDCMNKLQTAIVNGNINMAGIKRDLRLSFSVEGWSD